MIQALIDRLTRASLRFKWVTIALAGFFIVLVVRLTAFARKKRV